MSSFLRSFESPLVIHLKYFFRKTMKSNNISPVSLHSLSSLPSTAGRPEWENGMRTRGVVSYSPLSTYKGGLRMADAHSLEEERKKGWKCAQKHSTIEEMKRKAQLRYKRRAQCMTDYSTCMHVVTASWKRRDIVPFFGFSVRLKKQCNGRNNYFPIFLFRPCL